MNLSEIFKDFRIIEHECPLTCARNLNLSLNDIGTPQMQLGHRDNLDDDFEGNDERKGRSKKGKRKRNDNATTTVVASTATATAESRKTRTLPSGNNIEMDKNRYLFDTNEKTTVQEINWEKVCNIFIFK